MKLIPLLVQVVTEWPKGAEHVWQDSDGDIRFSGIPSCPADFHPANVGVADEVLAAKEHAEQTTFFANIEGNAGRALMVTQTEWQEACDARAE